MFVTASWRRTIKVATASRKLQEEKKKASSCGNEIWTVQHFWQTIEPKLRQVIYYETTRYKYKVYDRLMAESPQNSNGKAPLTTECPWTFRYFPFVAATVVSPREIMRLANSAALINFLASPADFSISPHLFSQNMASVCEERRGKAVGRCISIRFFLH